MDSCVYDAWRISLNAWRMVEEQVGELAVKSSVVIYCCWFRDIIWRLEGGGSIRVGRKILIYRYIDT